MSEATLQQRLVYEGIRAINDCVTKLPMAEAHEAINQLREHLEARAEQTAADAAEHITGCLCDKCVLQWTPEQWAALPAGEIPPPADDFADLLGA